MDTLSLIGACLSFAFLVPVLASSCALILPPVPGNRLFQTALALSGLSGLAGASLFFASTSFWGIAQTQIPGFFGAFGVSALSAFFIALISVGVFLTALFALEYLPRYRDTYALPWLNLATAFFVSGMFATVLAASVFTFLVAWEAMSVAAYFLVIADRTERSLKAGFLYFVMTHIGFIALAAGLLLLAGGNLFASFSTVAFSARSLPSSALAAAFVLLFAGFGSKAGLVPLHQWLPHAHPRAPSHASALLSGVMLKVALFGFIQSLFLFPGVPLPLALLVLVVGLVSAFFGVLHAAVERDLKRLLAWSSVENMGLIFSGIGAILVLLSLSSALSPSVLLPALAGIAFFVAFHTLNHMLFKSGLFMAAGAIMSETHTRNLDELGGLAARWPLFSGAFLALALAASALPPLGTFFGEWSYLQSLAEVMLAAPLVIAAPAAAVLALLALVGGLAVFAFAKAFSEAFLGRARTNEAEHVRPLPLLLVVPPVLCAAGLFVSALFASSFFASLTSLAPRLAQSASLVLPNASVDPVLIAASFALVCLALLAAGASWKRRISITDTWDCGAPLSSRMEYTATGFSAPMRFFFRSIVISEKRMTATPISARNPWIATKKIEWGIASWWERRAYAPIGVAVLALSRVARRLQSGSIQFYLVLVFMTLIASIVAAL